MAIVRIEGVTVADAGAVAARLASRGIEHATWGTERVPRGLAARTLSEDQRRAVLDAYRPELDELVARRGYVTADVVSLSPDTPKLDEILAVFAQEHDHADDEVRFIVAGRGIFWLRGRDESVLECEVHPGDLIVVPAGTWHWFGLCEDRQVVAVRVFKTSEGWKARLRHASPPAGRAGDMT
jgi:1,2-dihydroxy-3-keto-5-methylthiopentene dioxygenase